MSRKPPSPLAFERDLIRNRVSLTFGSKCEADAFCTWFMENYGKTVVPDWPRYWSRDLRVSDESEKSARWWRQYHQRICNSGPAA